MHQDHGRARALADNGREHMPETAMIMVPAAEGDSYWLDVEVPSGYPGSAGYVRAVVIGSAAGAGARQKAAALAEALDVPVRDEQVSVPQAPAESAAGIDFSHQADERLRSPFSQGVSEGRRAER